MKRILSELKIIDDLKVLFESSSNRVGIGDDAAVIEHQTLVSTDAMVEGIHFLREKILWGDVAYKLFASNASDMAAMGGYPTAYTLTLSLPEYWSDEDLKHFISGVRKFLHEFPADLIGGDLVRSKEFFASVTVIGKPYHIPILRTGAKPGDFIYCTGTLGDSKIWLNKELTNHTLPVIDSEYFKKRHYHPTPRYSWMAELVRYRISSAIDISDGLVEDLQKLTKASHVNFSLEASKLPLSIQQIGINNIEEHRVYYEKEALIGGEDYEIVFTSSDHIDEKKMADQGIKITKIGQIIPENVPSFVFWNKKYTPIENFQGFRH